MEKEQGFPLFGIKDSQWQGKIYNDNCQLTLFLIRLLAHPQ